jgi:hypothetical protein
MASPARRQLLVPEDVLRNHPDVQLVVRKTHASAQSDGPEYVLSDASVDRHGDIIEQGGWSIDHFQRNPVCLFNHIPSFLIGSWSRLRVEDGALRGRLTLAPEGTSDRIDEIRRLSGVDRRVEAGAGAREHDQGRQHSSRRH